MKRKSDSTTTWREKLVGKIPPELAREIDVYEMQIALKREGKLDDRVFAEARLRRGVYGQRYDDGLRFDGDQRRAIEYAEGPTKGPSAKWDAPGMQRVKLPWGKLTPDQLDLLAELAEEYADGVLHLTTRQDVQLHFVHLDDTPDLMRRLAAEGITTREACGNGVRNVTACPIAGVCPTEAFDVTPYAEALARYLLGHKDTQSLGRKFKISFSGCAAESCGLARMHDLGFIAKTREDGKAGFEVFVGGGLGALPHQAKPFFDFIEEEELLPLARSVVRVFSRLGEKKHRGKARLKFLVEKLGVDRFRSLVLEERVKLPFDPKWTAYLAGAHEHLGAPVRASDPLVQLVKRTEAGERELAAWTSANVMAQKQAGFAAVTVALPLGDLSSSQARKLAELARRMTGDHLRATVEQNIMLRFVRDEDLRTLFEELAAIGLADPCAHRIADIVSCPGTDTCRLGIASSRGLAAELRSNLLAKKDLDDAIAGLSIKVSGCFNACAQHQLADIGFYGVSRSSKDGPVPSFQIVLGGERENNAGAFGTAIGAVPAKNIPAAVDRITELFAKHRRPNERFAAFIERLGRKAIKGAIDDLTIAPAGVPKDWGDERPFTMVDHRGGEGAGHALSPAEMELGEAERIVFEAQLALDAGEPVSAAHTAYRAMLRAARALLRLELEEPPLQPPAIVAEFKARFFDTERFFDPAVRGRYAILFFRAHERAIAEVELAKKPAVTAEEARRRIEEAVLFVESSHACFQRVTRESEEEVES